MAKDDSEPGSGLDATSVPSLDAECGINTLRDRLRAYSAERPAIQRRLKHSGSPESEFARALVAERRLRDEVLGAGLFGEPVWDMLLDLFITHEEQQKVSVSSLCAAGAVPATTALRWINTLVIHGFAIRRQDLRDGRRIWIELSPHVTAQIRLLLKLWISQRGDKMVLRDKIAII